MIEITTAARKRKKKTKTQRFGPMKVCPTCLATFQAWTPKTTYCSTRCRADARLELPMGDHAEIDFIDCPECHCQTFRLLDRARGECKYRDGVCFNDCCSYTGFIDKNHTVKYMHSGAEVTI